MGNYVTKILDVSKWNKQTNLNDFKREGFTGIIIRAGYGKGNIDPKAEEWYQKAKEIGMDVGAYWFSYAKTVSEARQEAIHLISWCRGRDITLPLVYDYEYDSTQGKRVDPVNVNSFGKMFCSLVEDAGYYAMFYSNRDYHLNVWDNEMKSRFDCWYARYKSIPIIKKDVPNVHLAQYATSYKIGNKVVSQDVNYDFVGLAEIIKRKGLTGRI